MRTSLLLVFLSLYFFANSQVGLELNTYVSGLSQPLDIVHAGDERLFIVEKGGTIRIVDGDINLISTPFLDIDDRVNSFASERGLLGLAFHPNYANNGYFFVNYTNNSGNTIVSRFSVTEEDPNLADPDSELILLDINQPYSNHNGGCIRFGPDGYLYIGMGDGGSGGDPLNAGQDRQTLLGKMLRIDVDGGTPYAIPSDNPFADDDFTLDEVWALGIRNPWRFSFDRLNGDLWIGDVGQNDWEEIDYQPADSEGGENYGWRCYEGTHTYNTAGCPDANEMTEPVLEYANSNNVGCSVTGGVVYRGDLYPEAYGWYIYADFCSGRIWGLYPNGADGWFNVELLNSANNNLAGFGEDVSGEVYVAGISTGIIYRLDFSCEVPSTPLIEGDAAICGPDGSALLYVSNAPEGYAFQWYQDGELLDGENASTLLLHAPGEITVSLSAGESSCVPESATPVTIEEVNIPEDLITVSGNELQATPGFVEYQWFLDGAPIEGATESLYVAEDAGNYSVEVTDENGCTQMSFVFTIVATHDPLKIDQLSLSPNPFQDYLNLSFSVRENGRYQIRLMDELGKEFWKEKLSIQKQWNGHIPVSRLPKGAYFLEISHKGQLLALPIVKQ